MRISAVLLAAVLVFVGAAAMPRAAWAKTMKAEFIQMTTEETDDGKKVLYIEVEDAKQNKAKLYVSSGTTKDGDVLPRSSKIRKAMKDIETGDTVSVTYVTKGKKFYLTAIRELKLPPKKDRSNAARRARRQR